MTIDDEFAPPRVAKPPIAATQSRGLGKPITVDERTAGLDEMQQDILDDFVHGAKQLRQDIMINKGHRQAIFSDTVIREMGLRVPRDLGTMKAIPGINPEMVDRYGKKFMLLINNTRDMYARMAAAPQDPAPQEISDGDYDEADDEQVYDRNHENVIDLCGDSDDGDVVPADGSESNYSYGGSDDDDDDLRRSHHFTQPVDPEVEEFYNTLTQSHNANAAKATVLKRAPRAESSAPKKRGGYRKSGGSFGRGGYPGVRKRAASKATGSKTTAAAVSKKATGGPSRRGGAGGAGNGWSSIMGMPTDFPGR
jgi:bloom syndrome protein